MLLPGEDRRPIALLPTEIARPSALRPDIGARADIGACEIETHAGDLAPPLVISEPRRTGDGVVIGVGTKEREKDAWILGNCERERV